MVCSRVQLRLCRTVWQVVTAVKQPEFIATSLFSVGYSVRLSRLGQDQELENIHVLCCVISVLCANSDHTIAFHGALERSVKSTLCWLFAGF